MSPREVVLEYYESLRRGEPLYPYFLEDAGTTKIGVGETLRGYEAVAEGLLEQTRSTDSWSVRSHRLAVSDRDTHATFVDRVDLEWRDTVRDEWRSFDTRWTGTLEPSPRPPAPDGAPAGDADRSGETGDGSTEGDRETEWRFLVMHVSAPYAWNGDNL